ncbi:MAG: AbrB/MazE/SpoVT family DNA-binding domain-containing protein [Actinomycetota bacterium]
MKAATVSSKGQITIPAELIRRLGIEPGAKLMVVPVEGGIMLLRRPESLADDLAGSIDGVYGDPQEYVEAERREWS